MKQIEFKLGDDSPQGGVYNITHYLLEKNPTLKDSEVIGLPNEQEVTITEGQSMVEAGQDIWQLQFKMSE